MRKLIILKTLCLIFYIPFAFADSMTCTFEKQSPHARTFLLEKLSGEWLTHCIYTAAELTNTEFAILELLKIIKIVN